MPGPFSKIDAALVAATTHTASPARTARLRAAEAAVSDYVANLPRDFTDVPLREDGFITAAHVYPSSPKVPHPTAYQKPAFRPVAALDK